MRDLKRSKQKKVKENRRKLEKQSRDWRKLFERTLRITIGLGSGALIASGSVLLAQGLLESGYFGVNKIRVEHQARNADMCFVFVGAGNGGC